MFIVGEREEKEKGGRERKRKDEGGRKKERKRRKDGQQAGHLLSAVLDLILSIPYAP